MFSKSMVSIMWEKRRKERRIENFQINNSSIKKKKKISQGIKLIK